MLKKRNNYSVQEKVAILKRHLCGSDHSVQETLLVPAAISAPPTAPATVVQIRVARYRGRISGQSQNSLMKGGLGRKQPDF